MMDSHIQVPLAFTALFKTCYFSEMVEEQTMDVKELLQKDSFCYFTFLFSKKVLTLVYNANNAR